MRLLQSSIEKLAWWVVFVFLVLDIATFAKLTIDDNKKFHVLKANQDALICVVKGFNNPLTHQQHIDFIDNCVKANQ